MQYKDLNVPGEQVADISSTQERHVLIVNDGKRRAIALDAAAYSLGRDSSNAIVLNADTISRQHAMLLRVPVPGTKQYRYRLVDGNAQGKPSANGVFVNNQPCRAHELDHGDTVRFGQTLEASYLTVLMEEAEFNSYLESISYQSLKSDALNAKETLMAPSSSEEEVMTSFSADTQARRSPRAAVAPWAETLHEELPLPQDLKSDPTSKRTGGLPIFVVPGAVVAVALVTGAGLFLSRGNHAKPSPANAPGSVSTELKK